MLKEIFDEINKNNSPFENCQKTQLYIKEKFGFGYDTKDEIINDLMDEINEMNNEIANGNNIKIEPEMGDVLFVLCNLSSKYKIKPDDALKKSTIEFQERLEYIENKIGNTKMNKETIQELWEEAKNRKR